jgi:hypothetical protein
LTQGTRNRSLWHAGGTPARTTISHLTARSSGWPQEMYRSGEYTVAAIATTVGSAGPRSTATRPGSAADLAVVAPADRHIQGRPIAAPLERCAELLGVDPATVRELAAGIEPYIRSDGTQVWSLMQLERQLRPRRTADGGAATSTAGELIPPMLRPPRRRSVSWGGALDPGGWSGAREGDDHEQQREPCADDQDSSNAGVKAEEGRTAPIHPPRSATPNRRGTATAADAGTTNAIAVAQLSGTELRAKSKSGSRN